MNVEEQVKAKLLSIGFKEEQLLNNRGLIGAAIDETQEVVKNINYDTVLPTVTFMQLCPKCNGHGAVSKPPYVAGDVHEWTSSATSFTCDVCNGAKIIPATCNGG